MEQPPKVSPIINMILLQHWMDNQPVNVAPKLIIPFWNWRYGVNYIGEITIKRKEFKLKPDLMPKNPSFLEKLVFEERIKHGEG